MNAETVIYIGCFLGFAMSMKMIGYDTFRLFAAVLRVGYIPKINHMYYYSNKGPFGEILIPREVIGGYVKYEVCYENGINVFGSASVSTWALMCREFGK